MSKFVLSTMMAIALTCGVYAQEIKDREVNQQDRIAQGVKSGELTPHETAKLENQESRINREVRNDRKANGGNLTNKEKAQVNRQQNRESARIYNKKHNAAKN
jgi:hypothetical protein